MTLDAGGQLAIRPATLAQVAADDKLLRRLDADEAHVYGVKASELKHVAALLEASPPYLGPADEVARIATDRRAENGSDHFALDRARRWRRRSTLPRRGCGCSLSKSSESVHTSPAQAVQSLAGAALPLYMVYEERSSCGTKTKARNNAGKRNADPRPCRALGHGRVLQLKGKFFGDDGATRYYQIARPSNESLKLSSADPIEKLIRLGQAGRQLLVRPDRLPARQTDRRGYAAAIDYFTNRTRPLVYPDGLWTDRRASTILRRAYEASGQTERAILQYGSNDASPGYLGDLLRAKWLRERPK